MQPRSILVLTALAIVFLYVVIDITVLHADFSFSDGLKNRSVVVALFGAFACIAFLLFPKQQKEEEVFVKHEPSLQEAIVGIIFSPAPLHVKLEKSLQKVAKALELEQLFVIQYQSDALKRLYQLNTTHTLPQTFSLLAHANDSPLEKEVRSFYERKKETHTLTLPFGEVAYEMCFISLKAEHLLKPSGLLGALFKKGTTPSQEKIDTLEFLAQNIAFAISVVEKKEATLRANERHIDQQLEEDSYFNIFTNLKLRQIILYETKRNQRHKTDLSLMLFGIDYFDNLQGMLSPEKVLGIQKELVELIKGSLRNTDVFGVWDENIFAIVLPDVDFQSANALSRKLASLIAKKRFDEVGKLTCSFGITMFISPEDTLETFRRRAESALEKAQKGGGDKSEIKLLVSANHSAQ